MNLITLYRPVGLSELELIYDSGMKAFPARLPDQPIFYPVMNEEYAAQIAREWNSPRPKSYVGFVTAFQLPGKVIEQYERKVVGQSVHEELWIPADQLSLVNSWIQGFITVTNAFFGEGFKGYVPEAKCFEDEHSFCGCDASVQQQRLERAVLSGRAEAIVRANLKAVYLNSLYWRRNGLSPEATESLEKAWDKITHNVFALPGNVLC